MVGWHHNSTDMSLSKFWELVMNREAWHTAVHGVAKSWTRLSNFTFFLFLLLPSIFPSIRVFSNESVLHIRWPMYWSFSFSISPSDEYSGLTSFRIDWFDLLAVLRLSRVFLSPTVQKHQFFGAQPSLWSNSHSIHDYWKNHSFD